MAKKFDAAQAAKEAVQFTITMNEAFDTLRAKAQDTYGTGMRCQFMVKFDGDYLTNERVYRLLYENKVPCDVDVIAGKARVYFWKKEDAKMLRDVLNMEFYSKRLNDPERHPDNWSGLIHVERGPDQEVVA